MKLRNKKTGDVFDFEIQLKLNNPSAPRWIVPETFEQFCDEWEDYAPKDPLIKDEKIRKAVRAWAEVCGLSYVTYKQASNEFYDPDTRGAFAIRFRLIPVEVYLEDGECYTIDELCGEEEE